MANNLDAENQQWACRCLNVRVTAAQTSQRPPDTIRDNYYVPIFVNDNGISVTHPQVTVRASTKGVPIPGTSRCTRFTILTCLLCNLAVYRVAQTIPVDLDGHDTILLPTEEWVENEILKTATGWLEVHKDCLDYKGIQEAESSSSYATPFKLLLPPPSSPPPSSAQMEEESVSASKTTSKTTPTDVPAPTYLNLRPLFLPPPFTSSHPIFVHLTSLATRKSDQLRAEAEQRIADFVKSEAAGIEQREKELRQQVQVLWSEFRVHLRQVQHSNERTTNHTPSLPRSPSHGRENGVISNGLLTPVNSSSVTVKSFIPVPVTAPVHTPRSPSAAPKMSALSASLVTSGFHHPRERQTQSLAPRSADSGTSEGSGSSRTPSSNSGSSTLVHPPANPIGSTVLQFRRNVNDTINTNASYRYFLNLDEDMARYRMQQEEAKKKVLEQSRESQEVGPSQVTASPTVNGDKKSKKTDAGGSRPSAETSANKPQEQTTPSRGRDKGKRKVTFDVEPAVVTIKDDNKVEEESDSADPSQDMMFDLEEEGNRTNGDAGHEKSSTSDRQNPTLPLIEQPPSRPTKPRKAHSQSTARAMEAFASLRPASLPNPSHIRPIRSPPGVDSSSAALILSIPNKAKVSLATNESTSEEESEKEAEAEADGKGGSSVSSPIMSERDAEILRLVAADTPSHRGAWKPDSKAWKTFTRRQDSKEGETHGQITEENENDEDEGSEDDDASTVTSSAVDVRNVAQAPRLRHQPPVVGSLPISIAPRTRIRQPLSLASYKPENAIPEEGTTSTQPPLANGNQKPVSTKVIRRALYAERDRARAMDPGALDFTPEEEDEEVEEDETEEESEADAGAKAQTGDASEKSRKHALKILQARSELPEEGMWRSLAS